ERIGFLRQQILDQRRAVGRALRASAARSRADGGGGGSRFQTFLLWLPGGAHLSHLLARPALSCLSCGETVRGDDVVACDVPRCAGLFCRPCFLSLESTCAVCTRPLTSGEEGEEELDSSDDEQLNSGAGGSDIIDSDSQLSRHDVPGPTRVGRQRRLLPLRLLSTEQPAGPEPAVRPRARTGVTAGPPRTLQDPPGVSRTLQDPCYDAIKVMEAWID
uniref:DC-STAMP domain-containing protein 2 n=1 Tax=Gasterosteus aculeatus aculeatus TaxID=481459 RepID=UPI001A98FFEA